MLARKLEEAGLSTVGISLVRLHTQKVRPPRYLFVPFPYGRALGKPNDPAFQQEVIEAALALFNRPESEKPVLEDFPVILDEEPENDEILACALVFPPRKKEKQNSPVEAEEVAAEIKALRPFYEESRQKLGRTMVGTSLIPPEEIEKAALYLSRFALAQAVNPPERPPQTRPVQYLRWCADDLKAFYLEAAVAKQGNQPWTNKQLQDWLWKQTALGALILAVRRQINETGDAVDKGIGFGLVPRGY